MDDFAKSIGAIPRSQEQEDEFAKTIGAVPKAQVVASTEDNITPDTSLETPGATSTFARSAFDVPTFGFSDEIVGATHNLPGALKSIVNLTRDTPVIDADTEEYQAAKQKYAAETALGEEENRWSSRAGFAAGLLPSLLTGGAIAKGATGAVGLAAKMAPGAVTAMEAALPASRLGQFLAAAPKMAASGAALGAVSGAGRAEHGDVAEQAKTDALIGSILGPTLEGVLPAVAGSGHEALKKYNPTYNRMAEAASGVYNRGVDYLDENLRRKVLSEEGQKAADALVNTNKTISQQLTTEKQLAEPIDIDSLISPITEGVEKLKTIKPDTSKLENILASTSQQAASNLNKIEGRLSQATKSLAEKKAQLEALRQAKKEFTDKAMFSLDDTASAKAAASMEQVTKNETALASEISKLENEVATLPEIKNQVAAKAGESISAIKSQIDNMPNIPSSTYAGDVGKLETFADEISKNIFVTPQGQLPTAQIPAQEAVIRNMLTAGEAPLATSQGKSIANEVLKNIKSHYDQYGQTAELRDMMSKGLSAADMLEGVQSNPGMLDDTARETIKFTQSLLKASEDSKGSFQARELFDNADKLLNEVKNKAQELGRTDIVNSVDDFLAKASQTKQSAADWDMSRFLTNPMVPFTKSLPVRAAAAGASIAKTASNVASAPVNLTASFIKTASGQAHLDRLLADPNISQKSPSLYKYLDMLKNTQDEGKRKAIINIIQNNSVYTDLTKVESGDENGNETK